MKYSKLKHELEIKELEHKHEEQILKMKHEQEIKELKSKCTHKYEDGSSAKFSHGMKWDIFYKCGICGIGL